MATATLKVLEEAFMGNVVEIWEEGRESLDDALETIQIQLGPAFIRRHRTYLTQMNLLSVTLDDTSEWVVTLSQELEMHVVGWTATQDTATISCIRVVLSPSEEPEF